VIEPTRAESQPDEQRAPASGRNPGAGGVVALVLIAAIVSGAVSAGVTLAVLQSQARTNPQTLNLGSNVRITEENAVIQVAGKAGPAIATIVTRQTAQSRTLGAGFLTTSDGYIVTNTHVVANAAQLVVMFGSDANARDARLVDSDCQTGIAVLKVDGVSSLPTLAFAPALPRVGQTVVAMGTPLAPHNSLTAGVVSALHHSVTVADPVSLISTRQLADTIETDAAIDAGNSGGPLLNVAGQVVGINVAATADGAPLSFAINAADVQAEVEQIIRDGQLVLPDLGVQSQGLAPQEAALRGLPAGSLVTGVATGGPAAQAGIQEGDVLLQVDEVKVDEAHPLNQVLATRFRPLQRVTVTIQRLAQQSQLEVTLGRAHPHCP